MTIHIAKKRDLLRRYRERWSIELQEAALRPEQRSQITAEIDTITGIDEDLLRLDMLLRVHPILQEAR